MIDRTDRLTREGQLAAAKLLQRFIDADILLHIAFYQMVIRNDREIDQFLNTAMAAKAANDARIRAKMEAQRYAAKTKNRALKGNRPPYGWVYENLETNQYGTATKYWLVADRRVVNGYAAWDVRKQICREYLDGGTEWGIANRLSVEGVPTSRMIAGHPNAGVSWSASTIHNILTSPLNYGDATTFRQRVVSAPPDARHPTRWKKKEDAEHPIPITGYVKDLILTREEAAAIRARLAVGVKQSARGATVAMHAMLRGGMATCGLCGKSLRVKWKNDGATNMRYVCRIHEISPQKCSGISIPARLLDWSVWSQAFLHVLMPGALQELVEAQAHRDSEDDSASRFEELKRVKANFERLERNLTDAIAETDNKDVRGSLETKLGDVKASIRQATEDLAGAERLAADQQHRQNILANVEWQLKRHWKRIAELSAAMVKLDDKGLPMMKGELPVFVDELPLDVVASMRTICQSLGVEVSVPVEGEPQVTFNLGAATMQTWFPTDDPEVEPIGVTPSRSYFPT